MVCNTHYYHIYFDSNLNYKNLIQIVPLQHILNFIFCNLNNNLSQANNYKLEFFIKIFQFVTIVIYKQILKLEKLLINKLCLQTQEKLLFEHAKHKPLIPQGLQVISQ